MNGPMGSLINCRWRVPARSSCPLPLHRDRHLQDGFGAQHGVGPPSDLRMEESQLGSPRRRPGPHEEPALREADRSALGGHGYPDHLLPPPGKLPQLHPPVPGEVAAEVSQDAPDLLGFAGSRTTPKEATAPPRLPATRTGHGPPSRTTRSNPPALEHRPEEPSRPGPAHAGRSPASAVELGPVRRRDHPGTRSVVLRSPRPRPPPGPDAGTRPPPTPHRGRRSRERPGPVPPVPAHPCAAPPGWSGGSTRPTFARPTAGRTPSPASRPAPRPRGDIPRGSPRCPRSGPGTPTSPDGAELPRPAVAARSALRRAQRVRHPSR